VEDIMRTSLPVGLLVVGLGASGWALAQTAPLRNPSVQELKAALSAPPAGGGLTRGFARTQPPTQDGLCTQNTPSAARSTGTRNLEVVAYAPQAAHVDLAVTFGNDSDALGASSRQMLRTLAQALKSPDLATRRFIIAGHTSDTGARERNMELSCARALAVRRYLLQAGVAPERISAYGFGPDKPLLPQDPAADDNRRVEIRVGE
jgi:outer membrane protein OmpA-like peptidoglycan-associated protein